MAVSGTTASDPPQSAGNDGGDQGHGLHRRGIGTDRSRWNAQAVRALRVAFHRCHTALDRGNRGCDPQSAGGARRQVMTRSGLILASGSSSRRTMLAAAGVLFAAVVPEVDEDEVRAAIPAESAADGHAMAGLLAERKALSVSARYPDALVIGSDQVLVCEGRFFKKALDESEARGTLQALRGRSHE